MNKYILLENGCDAGCVYTSVLKYDTYQNLLKYMIDEELCRDEIINVQELDKTFKKNNFIDMSAYGNDKYFFIVDVESEKRYVAIFTHENTEFEIKFMKTLDDYEPDFDQFKYNKKDDTFMVLSIYDLETEDYTHDYYGGNSRYEPLPKSLKDIEI